MIPGESVQFSACKSAAVSVGLPVCDCESLYECIWLGVALGWTVDQGWRPSTGMCVRLWECFCVTL